MHQISIRIRTSHFLCTFHVPSFLSSSHSWNCFLPESSRDFCRGLVHALPFGSAHNMGAKDGIPGGQWEVS